MPKTKKIKKVNEDVSVAQTVLKRGTAVKELQIKNDVNPKLMNFFKVEVNPKSEMFQNLVVGINNSIEEFAETFSSSINIDKLEALNGDGWFTEVIEGMKKYCAEALSKVQSDARRAVLQDSGQVPAELWTVDKDGTSTDDDFEDDDSFDLSL